MKSPSEVQRLLEKSPFDRWIGMNVMEYSEGYCVVEAAIREEETNLREIAHGGILFSLCDAVSTFASAYGIDYGSVTQSATIYFFRPVPPGRIRVEGRLVHRNGNIACSDACILGESGKPLVECKFEHFFDERFTLPDE